MSTRAPDELAALRALIRTRASIPEPGERRRLREAAGLPQAAIAEASHVSISTVSMWERGAREPSGKAREAYARVLQVLREETARATGKRAA